jgi:hypothetical protein
MYEAYYHFKAKPFQLSPDPRFFFSSKGHRRAMSYLVYGVHQGDGFIVITGEVGAGKTMLANILARELTSRNLVLAQVVSTHLTADDMVRMVAAAFGLPQENSKAVLLPRRVKNSSHSGMYSIMVSVDGNPIFRISALGRGRNTVPKESISLRSSSRLNWRWFRKRAKENPGLNGLPSAAVTGAPAAAVTSNILRWARNRSNPEVSFLR